MTAVRQPATIVAATGAWVPLELGTTLSSGSWVSTGRRGRLMLGRGNDVIQIKPNSVASVSVSVEDGRPFVLVRQKYGTLLFDIETDLGRRFRIDTPFLGAVVKGTRFEISVGRQQVSMTVDQGTVTTTDIVRGLQVDVLAGQSVVLDARTPESLVVTDPGPKAAFVTVPPMSAIVAPAVTPQMAADDLSVGTELSQSLPEIAPNPDGVAPGRAVPDGVVPGEPVPGGAVPDGVVPDGALPGEPVPGGVVPDDTLPVGAVPDDTVPDDTVPDGAVPDDTVPDGAVPDDAAPDGVVPDGPAPDDAAPDDAAPSVDDVTPDGL